MDKKEEPVEYSEVMIEIVNDLDEISSSAYHTTDSDYNIIQNRVVKTEFDENITSEEHTTDDNGIKIVNTAVKTEFDDGTYVRENSTLFSVENTDTPISFTSEGEGDRQNGEIGCNSKVMANEYLTNVVVKKEAEVSYYSGDMSRVGINETNRGDFEASEKLKNEYSNLAKITSSDDGYIIDFMSKEDDKFSGESHRSEVDYSHEADRNDRLEHENEIQILIKQEPNDDFDEVVYDTENPDEEKKKQDGCKIIKVNCNVCDMCNKTFVTCNQLERHRIHFHPEGVMKEKPTKKPRKRGNFVCKVCDKSFPSKFVLCCHTATHTGEKPFACDVCGQTFSQSSSKRRHMKIHTGEKPFVCSYCGKSFTVKCYLKDHMVKHTGDQPHKCRLCDMTFAHRFSLQQHERLKHPGGEVYFNNTYDDRPFLCEVCGKKFTQKSCLKIHYRLHTGSKPYKCTECETSFIRRELLNRHKLEHTS